MPLSACESLIAMVALLLALEPAGGLGCGVVPNVFDFLVFGEPRRAQLAAVTRLSESAPLRRRGVVAEIVEPHRAVPKCPHHTLAPGLIRRSHARRETVLGVVAEFYRLRLAREPFHRENRSERLLPHDSHRPVTLVEDRRQVEVAVRQRRVA